jgi:hypothetical protein
VIAGCVAAITTLGGKDANGKRIDYIGNSNVVEQAGILGCERIILVTRSVSQLIDCKRSSSKVIFAMTYL